MAKQRKLKPKAIDSDELALAISDLIKDRETKILQKLFNHVTKYNSVEGYFNSLETIIKNLIKNSPENTTQAQQDLLDFI